MIAAEAVAGARPQTGEFGAQHPYRALPGLQHAAYDPEQRALAAAAGAAQKYFFATRDVELGDIQHCGTGGPAKNQVVKFNGGCAHVLTQRQALARPAG